MAVGYGREDSAYKEQEARIAQAIANSYIPKRVYYCLDCCDKMDRPSSLCPRCVAKRKKQMSR